MANLFELKRQRADALNRMDNILALSENGKRELTQQEQRDIASATTQFDALSVQIKHLEKNNTLAGQFGSSGPLPITNGVGLMVSDPSTGAFRGLKAPQRILSPDYVDGFFGYISSGGKEINAALYEGAGSSGGYAVPIVVDDQIVPLAPQEMAVRRLAQVIPTASDVKIPAKLAFGTAAITAELGTFAGTAPTLEQFTLSAFMAGVLNAISWELAQDVPSFQSFVVQDMILSQQMLEENLYVNGTGSGQAQGLIGNVGSGISVDPDATSGSLISLAGVLDLIATLNAVYHPGASFLMTRATSIIIRKAQVSQNLFEPAWTRVGKQDFLYGYPVEYSAYMPTAARGATPVLFGDFKQGYLIGDRGGSGINVKVLDQPLASQGQIQLLTYRRTDGRVRRSEAIQSYNITASGTSSPA